MKKYILLAGMLLGVISAVDAAPQFVKFDKASADNALLLTGTKDTIRYSPSDWKGVKMAVANLRHDLRSVTGSEYAPVVVATVGKSEIAKKYPKQSKLLKGKWEQYLIFTDKGQLVILGSDKRGTIYGIYELSRQIGVSPWYWMADAPIQHHDQLYILPGTYTDGEPKVKYRGIFINDEWPSFGGWCGNQFGGINSKAYSHIFELLLRLKANYFWPAMWATAFNEDDPKSPQLADDMGIVMGTSHHEPMMRAHKEYVRRKAEVGPWDYAQNPERIEKFFSDGLKRNSKYENIITIGMRGDGDVAMGNGKDEDNIKTLGKVIEAQRRIIRDCYGKPASSVPQLWAIFTEVQRYYDAGFNVPDDVTLLFCDNNWGYIRRKGTAAERKRKGGIQSAADTHYHRLGMGMDDALGKTHQLDIENLLAGGIHIAAGRNKRMRIHLSLQHEFTLVLSRIGIDVTDVELSAENRILDVALGVDIGGIGTTLRTEFLYINLRDNHLRIKRETLTLCK